MKTKENPTLAILLSSLGFISFHFLISLYFTLNFNKHGWNGEEEERRRLILLLGLYMFFNMLVKHVVDFQTLFFQREWKKFIILSLVYESMGHKERSIGSQVRMCGFVDRLLLGLGKDKEFRKRT